jgi:hypothetical protein
MRTTLGGKNTMPRFVTEFHYTDGDVGAYDDIDVDRLWAQLTKTHEPSHILIRPDTEQGQSLSNLLQKATKMQAALQAFVDTINATGGVVHPDSSEVAPAADEEWLDLGLAYAKACEVLGIPPVVTESGFSEDGPSISQ